MGTSVALAAREAGAQVWLSDSDDAVERLAADLGAGEILPAGGVPGGRADLAVLAMPPAAVAAALASAQERDLASVYTDVASVKVLPIAQARQLGCDLASYVAGHPLAGSERSGPAAARADLFLGRPWALCPLPETAPEAFAAVRSLVHACGAVPVEVDAREPRPFRRRRVTPAAPGVGGDGGQADRRGAWCACAGRPGAARRHQDCGGRRAHVDLDPHRERLTGREPA